MDELNEFLFARHFFIKRNIGRMIFYQKLINFDERNDFLESLIFSQLGSDSYFREVMIDLVNFCMAFFTVSWKFYLVYIVEQRMT